VAGGGGGVGVHRRLGARWGRRQSGAGPAHGERGETGRRPDRPAVGHGDGLAAARVAAAPTP